MYNSTKVLCVFGDLEMDRLSTELER